MPAGIHVNHLPTDGYLTPYGRHVQSPYLPCGDLILIRPLFLLIIPLVFVSVVVGMTSIGDPSKLGVVGGSTLAYYLVTMLIACIIGAVLVTTFRPGDLSEEATALLVGQAEADYADAPAIASSIQRAEDDGLGGAWMNILRQLVPRNVVYEMAHGRTLGVIVFDDGCCDERSGHEFALSALGVCIESEFRA